MKLLFLSIIFLITATSCSKEDDNVLSRREFDITIASKRIPRNGIIETPSSAYTYYVKKEDNNQWETFSHTIAAFDFQEGYECKIRVLEETLKEVPMDAPNVRYHLVKQISKEKKESENLPI